MKAFWRTWSKDAPGERDPEAAIGLGMRLAEQGDIEGAREAYRQAANSGHPEYAPVAARNLGRLNQQVGRYRQAYEAYQVAIESGHRDAAPWAMVDLGNLISDSLYPENARPFYQMAMDSGHPEAAQQAARHLADRKGLLPAERPDVSRLPRLIEPVQPAPSPSRKSATISSGVRRKGYSSIVGSDFW